MQYGTAMQGRDQARVHTTLRMTHIIRWRKPVLYLLPGLRLCHSDQVSGLNTCATSPFPCCACNATLHNELSQTRSQGMALKQFSIPVICADFSGLHETRSRNAYSIMDRDNHQ